MLLLRTLTAALLINWGLSWAAPCPENVVVSCENLKITVRWDCQGQQPETSFRVKMMSYSTVSHEAITKHSEYDLSHYVWKSKDISLSFLYVTVTALHGGNQSKEVESNTFSFNALGTIDTYCLLEFPPVFLVVDKTSAVVKFPNPFQFYDEIKQAYKTSADSLLKFTVTSGINLEKDAFCRKAEPTCTTEVTFPDSRENCVTLKGWLIDDQGIDELPINQTQKICGSEKNGNDVILLIILLCIFGMILSVAVIVICKVKAWTMKSPPLPKLLDVKHSLTQKYVLDEKITAVTIQGSSEKAPHEGSGELLLKGLEDSSPFSGRNRKDYNSTDSSVKTETLSMSSEDDEMEYESPYESREPVPYRDMGNGDMVIAYTGT
uniref:Fibronectin type-III domain-containing protein n=1 Tax=Oryzias latipes TaxID=8090 RepID=A0A3P9I3X2_ORYLA